MAIELPEALTLARQMDSALRGKTVAGMELRNCASLIRQGFINLDQVDLVGLEVGPVSQHGKWIFTRLEPGWNFLIALETSGQVLYHPNPEGLPEKYSVRLNFTDGSLLTVCVVGWGFVKAVRDADLPSHAYPGQLGVSPLDENEFSFKAFESILEAFPKKAIQDVLTNQRVIAGIGRGYAKEIFYWARLHPMNKVSNLTLEERQRLYQVIVLVLEDAIRLGGRITETDLYGNPGSFEPALGEDARD